MNKLGDGRVMEIHEVDSSMYDDEDLEMLAFMEEIINKEMELENQFLQRQIELYLQEESVNMEEDVKCAHESMGK
jgi:hypothetical protein